MELILSQILNSLQYGCLLFLASIGLTMVVGMTGFINLAHGLIYAFGAYLTYSIYNYYNNYLITITLVTLVACIAAFLFYKTITTTIYSNNHLEHALITFSLLFIAEDVIKYFWGTHFLTIQKPITGQLDILNFKYPTFRYFFILFGVSFYTILSFIVYKTKAGIILRAISQSKKYCEISGINSKKIISIIFVISFVVTAITGSLILPITPAHPAMMTSILVPCFSVAIIGGLGSINGSFLASMIIAFIYSFGSILIPEYFEIIIYTFLILTIIIKPQGLMPIKQ